MVNLLLDPAATCWNGKATVTQLKGQCLHADVSLLVSASSSLVWQAIMRADVKLLLLILSVQEQEWAEQYGPDSVLPSPRQR